VSWLLNESGTQKITTFDGSVLESSNEACVQFYTEDRSFSAYAGVLDTLPSGMDIVIRQYFMRFHEVSLHLKVEHFALQMYLPQTAQRIELEQEHLPTLEDQNQGIAHMSYKVADKLGRWQQLMIAGVKPTVAAAAAAFAESTQDVSSLPQQFQKLLFSFPDILNKAGPPPGVIDRGYRAPIITLPGAQPVRHCMYRLTPLEKAEVEKQLE
jgi:hypothetical protein